jgi:hypothetical protein
MTVKEKVSEILKNNRPEEVLSTIMKNPVIETYIVGAFDPKNKDLKIHHPLAIIAEGAEVMGWVIAVEQSNPEDEIRGLAIGTEEYLKKLLKNTEIKEDDGGSKEDNKQISTSQEHKE